MELSRRTREFQDPVSVPPADYGLSTGVAGIEPSGLGQILEIGKPDHYLSLTSTNDAHSIGHADIGEELEMIFGSKNFHITYVTLILLVGCSGSSGSRCIRRMSGSDRCDCAANLGLRRNSGIVEEV